MDIFKVYLHNEFKHLIYIEANCKFLKINYTIYSFACHLEKNGSNLHRNKNLVDVKTNEIREKKNETKKNLPILHNDQNDDNHFNYDFL